MPHLFLPGDAFCVIAEDPDTHERGQFAMYDERHARRMPFTRELPSFRTGETVSKNCPPYGSRDEMYNRMFKVQQKFFDQDGTVLFVCLRLASESSQCCKHMLVTPEFFSGWQNDCMMNEYYGYHK